MSRKRSFSESSSSTTSPEDPTSSPLSLAALTASTPADVTDPGTVAEDAAAGAADAVAECGCGILMASEEGAEGTNAGYSCPTDS